MGNLLVVTLQCSVCFTAALVPVRILHGETTYLHCLFKSVAVLKFFSVELQPFQQDRKSPLKSLATSILVRLLQLEATGASKSTAVLLWIQFSFSLPARLIG